MNCDERPSGGTNSPRSHGWLTSHLYECAVGCLEHNIAYRVSTRLGECRHWGTWGTCISVSVYDLSFEIIFFD